MASVDSSPNESTQFPFLEGGCACKYVRYRMVGKPLIVHCCHCLWCQRESGSAFAINAMFEADHVIHLGPEPTLINVPSESGEGQTIARCPKCLGAIWSIYGTDGPALRFVKVGTLDQSRHCPPDIHIFTMSKQQWVKLPESVPALEETYKDPEGIWSKESIERWKILMELEKEKVDNKETKMKDGGATTAA